LKKKTKKARFADEPPIRAARQNVNKAFDAYSTRSTRRREQNLQEEKRKLEQAYHQFYEKNLENKSAKCKPGKPSERKTTKKGIIKANSREERIDKYC